MTEHISSIVLKLISMQNAIINLLWNVYKGYIRSIVLYVAN